MQDLRLAVRTLYASPLVTAIAVVSLALGIGANTAIFSLVSRLLLRSLPVVAPERLAMVSRTASPGSRQQFSYATFDQIRQHRGHVRRGSTVGSALRRVNDDLTLTFEPLTQQVDESLAADRVLAMLSGSFGAVALLLAGLGLYGVTAYAVARRRIEIGIRMAIGAAPAAIVRIVLSRVPLLVGVGVLAGVSISVWAATSWRRYSTVLNHTIRQR